jgi:hypothetical protein
MKLVSGFWQRSRNTRHRDNRTDRGESFDSQSPASHGTKAQLPNVRSDSLGKLSSLKELSEFGQNVKLWRLNLVRCCGMALHSATLLSRTRIPVTLVRREKGQRLHRLARSGS